MTYGRGVQAYTQTQVFTTTNQKELIVMAYDGVLKFLNQAKEHIVRREIELKYNALIKARAILEELARTLNLEKGGEIAKNLWNLYSFFMQQISSANLTNDPATIEGILPAIRDLRDGWAAMEIPQDDLQTNALNRRVPVSERTCRVSITG